ncbi:hypothetical protein SEPCBS119000_003136 [Sporothrix epigloea]|uniref:ATP-dependent DNA ligase family profile domain-containing protein n=1 Tax=Sporothrix epigloea TaxID=1892477 RepID=A0ABP0DLY8_9PEZI
MPFSFDHVCNLFQQIEDLPPARRNQPGVVKQLIYAWFAAHRTAVEEMVNGTDTDTESATTSPPAAAASSAVALLSTLLPDRRTDRVYGLQARSLQRTLVRALGLGHSRISELSRWMQPCRDGTDGPVDLADCVEAILHRTPNPVPAVPVSVEEVDAVLQSVAAQCRFSGPAIRGTAARDLPYAQLLTRIYQRLDARGAKWFTRVILKDLRPVVLDSAAVARSFHRDLPLALQVHDDLAAAVQTLRQEANQTTGGRACPPRPQLGTKVGRQRWIKGRSIENCISLAGPQRISCEHKLDGEYVQVHIDLTRDRHGTIQLFSKSGKDSTWDREQLHGAIRDSLRLGQPGCPLKSGCILEGEMLAYDDRNHKVLDFDAIRRHVSRSGTRLYVDPREEAEARHCQEHLMIVYYDVLAVDEESLLPMRHGERFRRLQSLITCRAGYAEVVPREVIDFAATTAPAALRRAFARCLTARLEGLVLKPEDRPYFHLPGDGAGAGSPCIIKLKRGYVGGFGEAGDLAIVGAYYDAAKAREYPAELRGLHWTHFYLGCLDTTRSTRGRPRFIVTNVVTLPTAQMSTFLKYCRPRTVRLGKRKRSETPRDIQVSDSQLPFDVARLEPSLVVGQNSPTDWFADPPVVEIRCFSFHRQGYGQFWSPRFPNVVKFHFDRSGLTDVLTYAEIQIMAEEATRSNPAALETAAEDDGNAREEREWEERLKKADRRGIAVDAETSQSSSASTASQTLLRPAASPDKSRSTAATATPLATLPQARANGGPIEVDSQASVIVVEPEKASYDDKENSQQSQKNGVTIIDLTREDDTGDDGVGSNAEAAGVSTPKPTATGAPPSDPATPRQLKTPRQAASPLLPASCSPIDIVSSLAAWMSDASQTGSQDSQATETEATLRESRQTPRKRLLSQDAATLYAAVSPPIYTSERDSKRGRHH